MEYQLNHRKYIYIKKNQIQYYFKSINLIISRKHCKTVPNFDKTNIFCITFFIVGVQKRRYILDASGMIPSSDQNPWSNYTQNADKPKPWGRIPTADASFTEVAQFGTSQRGGELMFYEGKRFTRDGKFAETTNWRCAYFRDKCKARAITKEIDGQILVKVTNNVHTCQPKRVPRRC